MIQKQKTYIRMAATTTRPERPFNPVSSSTSLLRFLPLTILCSCLIYLLFFCNVSRRNLFLLIHALLEVIGMNTIFGASGLVRVKMKKRETMRRDIRH